MGREREGAGVVQVVNQKKSANYLKNACVIQIEGFILYHKPMTDLVIHLWMTLKEDWRNNNGTEERLKSCN